MSLESRVLESGVGGPWQRDWSESTLAKSVETAGDLALVWEEETSIAGLGAPRRRKRPAGRCLIKVLWPQRGAVVGKRTRKRRLGTQDAILRHDHCLALSPHSKRGARRASRLARFIDPAGFHSLMSLPQISLTRICHYR